MIDASFVESITNIAETEQFTLGDRDLFSKPVFNPPLPEEPRASTLAISTLGGFVEFCKAPPSRTIGDIANVLIHVESPTKVSLLSKLGGVAKYRDVFLTATRLGETFKFNQFQDHSNAMIALQVFFLEYGDRGNVLRVLGTIKDESVKIALDDGLTQRVTASTGVTLSQEVPVPNPVLLQPYRTFSEVQQPPSKFILRVKSGGDALPQIALFESDGGAWKLEAIASIREYLAAKLPEFTIIA